MSISLLPDRIREGNMGVNQLHDDALIGLVLWPLYFLLVHAPRISLICPSRPSFIQDVH